MLKRNVHRSSGELPISAISEKSRSHAGGVIRGIGDRPNKQENVRFRESGDRAVFGLCHNTGIACRFTGLLKSSIIVFGLEKSWRSGYNLLWIVV